MHTPKLVKIKHIFQHDVYFVFIIPIPKRLLFCTLAYANMYYI